MVAHVILGPSRAPLASQAGAALPVLQGYQQTLLTVEPLWCHFSVCVPFSPNFNVSLGRGSGSVCVRWASPLEGGAWPTQWHRRCRQCTVTAVEAGPFPPSELCARGPRSRFLQRPTLRSQAPPSLIFVHGKGWVGGSFEPPAVNQPHLNILKSLVFLVPGHKNGAILTLSLTLQSLSAGLSPHLAAGRNPPGLFAALCP